MPHSNTAIVPLPANYSALKKRFTQNEPAKVKARFREMASLFADQRKAGFDHSQAYSYVLKHSNVCPAARKVFERFMEAVHHETYRRT